MSPETPNLHTNGPATVSPPAVAAETNPRVTVTAHAFEVKAVAGPTGFRWFIQGLLYPSAKTGSKGETYFLGKPTRKNVAGPYRTKAEADAVLSRDSA